MKALWTILLVLFVGALVLVVLPGFLRDVPAVIGAIRKGSPDLSYHLGGLSVDLVLGTLFVWAAFACSKKRAACSRS